jgi:hypothetical protein
VWVGELLQRGIFPGGYAGEGVGFHVMRIMMSFPYPRSRSHQMPYPTVQTSLA